MTCIQGLLIPVELWCLVFDHVRGQRDRAQLLRVCRSFESEARSALYKSVFLCSHSQAQKFYCVLLRNRQLASVTQKLVIHAVTNWDGLTIPAFLPALFSFLVNVRHFDLRYFYRRPEEMYPVKCDLRMDDAWFPNLRALVTTLPLSSEIAFPRFLQAHPRIEELYAPQADASSWSLAKPPASIPSLRIVSCQPLLLRRLASSTITSITHLDLHKATDEDLSHIIDLVGPQLASLRMSEMLYGGRGWSVYEIVTRLPVLRYLEVDMLSPKNIPPGRPYLSIQPVDWYQKVNIHVCEAPLRRLQVVWSFSQERALEVDKYGQRWRDYLTGVALEVLTAWRPYVFTVTFLHPAMWEATVALAADGYDVERRPDIVIRRGDWRYA